MKLFFYRICGMGMGTAAKILREQGFHVEGGDYHFRPPMSTYLEKASIPLHRLDKISDRDLKSFDAIVVGNVVAKKSPDAQRIESLGVLTTSFPSILGEKVLFDRRVVGITGTHGKTTTTSFCTQIFENMGKSPGRFIGGVIDGIESACLGDSKDRNLFFIEADEYDSAYFEKISKFRLYNIEHLILTSLEFDHADIFESIDDIKEQFRSLIETIQTPIIFCSDYPAARALREDFKSKEWISYGSESKQGPYLIRSGPTGSLFEVELDGKRESFETNIVGLHNIYNLTAVIIWAYLDGHPLDDLRRAMKHLRQVKRRQELKGFYKGSPVIDDFAHHPRALQMTLQGVRAQYPNKKVHVVFEASSATARSSIFQQEFEEALLNADGLTLVRPERPTSVKKTDNLSLEKIATRFKKASKQAHIVENRNELLDVLSEIASPQTVIFIATNGNILNLWDKLELTKKAT